MRVHFMRMQLTRIKTNSENNLELLSGVEIRGVNLRYFKILNYCRQHFFEGKKMKIKMLLNRIFHSSNTIFESFE